MEGPAEPDDFLEWKLERPWLWQSLAEYVSTVVDSFYNCPSRFYEV